MERKRSNKNVAILRTRNQSVIYGRMKKKERKTKHNTVFPTVANGKKQPNPIETISNLMEMKK